MTCLLFQGGDSKYMANEVLHSQFSKAADIFSLGKVERVTRFHINITEISGHSQSRHLRPRIGLRFGATRKRSDVASAEDHRARPGDHQEIESRLEKV